MGYGDDVIDPETAQGAIDAFHVVYFNRVASLRWLGVPAMKCPVDLFAYQELICQTQPDVIIETGTAFGGSAMFLASVCQAIGRGRVITVDTVIAQTRPMHPLVTYLIGSSTDNNIVERVRQETCGDRTMVILDSDHHADHVYAELDLYSGMVTPGCYLIVEDTNLNGHPVAPSFGPGPWEALEAWLPEHQEFERDDVTEQKHVLTFNPRGYLRRLP